MNTYCLVYTEWTTVEKLDSCPKGVYSLVENRDKLNRLIVTDLWEENYGNRLGEGFKTWRVKKHIRGGNIFAKDIYRRSLNFDGPA